MTRGPTHAPSHALGDPRDGMAPIGIAPDRPRPPVSAFRRGRVSLALGKPLSTRAIRRCERGDVSLLALALAAHAIVLCRHAAQPEIVIRMPAARDRHDGSVARLVALRIDLVADPSGDDLLRGTAARMRDAADDDAGLSALPFMLLTQGIDHELHDRSADALVRSEMREHTARSDLAITIRGTDDGLELEADHDAELYEAATIQRVLAQARLAIAGLLERPEHRVSSLSLLDDDERETIVRRWNATDAPVSLDACIHELIERQVDRTPERIALRFHAESLSYRELDRQANRLARRLIACGVGPDVLVAIGMARSLEMVVAILAVLKAGGAYVPLDPAYPESRLESMLRDSAATVLLTRAGQSPVPWATHAVRMEVTSAAATGEHDARPDRRAGASDLAYVIYTSGSTGEPKGVMIEHRNIVNFFAGMDARIGGDAGVWLAVTSLSFDISVLELLWPLTRGFEVVLYAADIHPLASVAHAPRAPSRRPLDVGLFYFASDDDAAGAARPGRERYRLLMEGARFADEHGFSAVWTPERHFHAFGGLYPSPSVTSAALSMITRRVRIRAGSVVLPLHDPVRVAEEWSVIDNLSDGRVAISFASGWQPEDFVFAPEQYAARHDVMFRGIDEIRRLWRGETLVRPGGHGTQVGVRIRPTPVQPELPCWVTAGGTPSTFRRAGAIGANVLTHLLGQSLAELAEKIAIYREAWRAAGHDADGSSGHVSLMLHTFIGADDASVRAEVTAPFRAYLRGSVSLFTPFASALGLDVSHLSARELDVVVDHAFERYYQSSGLFGTPASCLAMVERLREVGVDEIACLIDFGIPTQTVLESLPRLEALRERANARSAIEATDHSIAATIARHGVTHLQCTPSLASLMLADPASAAAMRGLRTLLIGGETFSPALASTIGALAPDARVLNMYGPTETTIWSTTHDVAPAAAARDATVPIGRPIANTRLYILDDAMRPVPIGIVGELYIGGHGVARGYLRRPELTAQRFIADPIDESARGRLYRTGDRARYRADGSVEYAGRRDGQVKIRGHRIELGEIEAVLRQHPAVDAAVVTTHEDVGGDRILIAHVVPRLHAGLSITQLRAHAAATLPAPMVPSTWMIVPSLPLTPNGKIDRQALPAPEAATAEPAESFEGPTGDLECAIAECWRAALGLPRVDVRDDFFGIGGHSLLVIHVQHQLSARLGRTLSMADMFRHPTIRGYAAFLEAEDRARVPGSAPTELSGPIIARPRIAEPR